MEVVELVTALLVVAKKLLDAKGDADMEREAMMEAQEVLKAEFDRRKFGAG